ncbi:Uncharacterized protein Rs2_36278 [Raphanus sativus]|nr:Uncharacterized protein Rs2_36278 [Raphanus sativus]
MAPSSSSSPSKSPVLSLHQALYFTPIPECEEEDLQEERYKNRATPSSNGGSSATPSHHKHTLTPLHHTGKPKNKKRHEEDNEDRGGSVSCNNCRPTTLTAKKSPTPKLSSAESSLPPRSSSSSSSAAASSSREEQWRLAVAELSHKLIQTTKKKEDAVTEASRLKSSMSDLEKKLNKLEIYCHNLKSGLDECSSNKEKQSALFNNNEKQSALFNNKKQSALFQKDGFNDKIIQQFLLSVSESRTSIRGLSRALASQLRTVGGKVYERLSLLLQPFDVKINSKSLILYLEAILSRAFFEDFEASGFQKNGSTRILNPIDRCESSYASFNVLTELKWDEVLSRGTKHFSEEFSQFCDRKMSDVVSMLCWNRAWPEPLLQAFFGASKSVWLVHLLANSVNPGLQIFRVEKDDRFDPVYMEGTGGDRFKDLVRAMVQPGFYVYGSVVKCKVVCKHCSSGENEVVEDSIVKECNKTDKSLISICSPLGG